MSGRWEPPPWVELATLPDGSALIRCRICPRFTADSRDTDNPANHSSIAIQQAPMRVVQIWVRAHIRSDMHSWYRRRVLAEPTEEDLLLARIFHTEPRPRKARFEFAVDTKRRGIRPKW